MARAKNKAAPEGAATKNAAQEAVATATVSVPDAGTPAAVATDTDPAVSPAAVDAQASADAVVDGDVKTKVDEGTQASAQGEPPAGDQELDDANTAAAIDAAPDAAAEIQGAGGVDTAATAADVADATVADAGSEATAAEVAAAAQADADAQAAANIAAAAASTAGDVGDAEELEFPARIRVTNNTRMPIQVPAVDLSVDASPAFGETTLNTRGAYDTMLRDLEALRLLGGFSEGAFTVEFVTEES